MEPDHLHERGDNLLVVGARAWSREDSTESGTEKAAQVKNFGIDL